MLALLRQPPLSTCRAQHCNSLSSRTNHALCINRRSSRRPPNRPTSLAVRAQQQAPQEKRSDTSEETFWLPTITAASSGLTSVKGGLKANVVFPSLRVPKEGDPPVPVWPRGGVVLFMHGFAQGPTAYARMLTQLAKDCQVLVVAPCPPFGWTLNAQQSAMVEAALFWRDLIANNALPGIIITPPEGSTASSSTSTSTTSSSSSSSSSASSSSPACCPLPVGLLAHSVGGGLAPYVVATAAKKQQPFTTAHVMAPQTGLVWCPYRYQSLGTDDKLLVPTTWAVQYGYLDLLSPFFTVDGFLHWLNKLKAPPNTPTVKYNRGTHVGFEDQLVVGVDSFTASFLPRVLAPLATAALLLLALGSAVMTFLAMLTARLQGKKGDSGPEDVQPGFGTPDKVVLPDESSMLLSYVVLAGAFTAAAVLLLPYDWQWDSPGPWVRSAAKAIVTVLAVFAWPNILVFPYVADEQRPKVRSEVVKWFSKPSAAAEAAPPPSAGVAIKTAIAAAAAVALSYGIITIAQALQ